MQFPVAKTMPALQSAASCAAYPKASASAVQASITRQLRAEKLSPPARQPLLRLEIAATSIGLDNKQESAMWPTLRTLL